MAFAGTGAFTANDAAHAAQYPYLATVRLLAHNEVTPAAVASLAKLTHLHRLELKCCMGIDGAGLAEISKLKNLRHLDLSWCRGLDAACLGNIKELRYLSLRGWDSVHAAALSTIAGLRCLEELDLSNCNRVDARALACLAESEDAALVEVRQQGHPGRVACAVSGPLASHHVVEDLFGSRPALAVWHPAVPGPQRAAVDIHAYGAAVLAMASLPKARPAVQVQLFTPLVPTAAFLLASQAEDGADSVYGAVDREGRRTGHILRGATTASTVWSFVSGDQVAPPSQYPLSSATANSGRNVGINTSAAWRAEDDSGQFFDSPDGDDGDLPADPHVTQPRRSTTSPNFMQQGSRSGGGSGSVQPSGSLPASLSRHVRRMVSTISNGGRSNGGRSKGRASSVSSGVALSAVLTVSPPPELERPMLGSEEDEDHDDASHSAFSVCDDGPRAY